MRQLDIHVVRFEGSQEEAIHGLESEFGLNHEAAVRFVQSVPRLARSGTAPQEAQAYQRVLNALGAVVELRPTLSLPTPGDAVVPSLPRPPVLISSVGQTQFDSSAALAQRVPRAPAVPLEAWTRVEGGMDEMGNPLPDADREVPGDPELLLRSWAAGASAASVAAAYGPDGNPTWTVHPRSDLTAAANATRTGTRWSRRTGLLFGLALFMLVSLAALYLRWQRPAAGPQPVRPIEAGRSL